MTIAESIILAVVEGITEFLPISSTGHMIVVSSILGIEKDEFTKLFEVSIQFGAILAVVVLYAKKFFAFRSWQFYAKLVVGVIPAIVLGAIFADRIDKLLESPTTVAISMVAGGIILLFVDSYFKKPVIESDDQVSYKNAFLVGIWQTLALIPGVSRSAASIVGGMSLKFTRWLAAEFSFFLAVPTLFAVSVHALFIKHWKIGGLEQKGYQVITATRENTIAFMLGNVIAFIIALLAIRLFMSYLKISGFRIFGIYRILAGLILLSLLLFKVI